MITAVPHPTPEEFDEALSRARKELTECYFSCCQDQPDLREHFGTKLNDFFLENFKLIAESSLSPSDQRYMLFNSQATLDFALCTVELAFSNVSPSKAKELTLKAWEAKARRMSAAYEADYNARRRNANAYAQGSEGGTLQ